MRATPQWFLKVDPLRDLALEEIKKGRVDSRMG
jgi:isoleucyl-tRNA synthetase